MFILQQYFLCIIIGYLLGTSNMALYISKFKKINLRDVGSGNLGTSNVTAIIGKRAGIITFLHDTLKVLLAVWICNIICNDLEYCTIVTATSSVLGHMYPFYLKFRGGKGFAPYIGLCFALDWKFGLVMLIGMLIVSLIADWIVAGTFFFISITPIFLLITKDWISALIVFIASFCIFLKHIENLKRKKLGTEMGIKEVIFKKKKLI